MEKILHGNGKKSVLNLFKCKCPRCRTGNMFVNPNPYVLKETMKMNGVCPVCNQPFNIEVGFYYGSSYISYSLTIALSVATFVAWWVLFGFSLYDNRIFYWLGINTFLLVALQPYLMRVSRTGWLAFFVKYERDWKAKEIKKYDGINEQWDMGIEKRKRVIQFQENREN